MKKRRRGHKTARADVDVRAPEAPPAVAGMTQGQRLVTIATLSLWCGCSVFLAGVIPPGDAPDEAAHLEHINHLARTWTFPDFRLEPTGTEAHQPPLYYALCAALTAATGASLLGLRLVSTACGLALIVVTFALARSWAPDRGFGFHWCCAAVVGFLPMNLYICSAVNNDPLIQLLVAVGLLHVWRTRDREGSLASPAMAGVIAGLAMLTKSTALGFVTTCLVWYGMACLGKEKRREGLRALAAFVVVLAVIWGPWATRNTVMYGDPLGARAFAAHVRAPAIQLGAPGLDYWIHWVAPFSWFTLWGGYDHLIHRDDFMPMAWYIALTPVCLLAAYGLASRWRGVWAGREPRRIALSLAAGAGVLLAAYVSFNFGVFQAQTRYFFSYLPIFAVGLCAGLDALGGWRGRAGPVCLLALLAIGCVDGVAWRMWFTG